MSVRLITSRELRETKINTTRMRRGYDMDETDDVLDSAAETLAWYEHRFGPEPIDVPAPIDRKAGK